MINIQLITTIFFYLMVNAMRNSQPYPYANSCTVTLQDTLTSFIESVKQKELLTSVLAIVKVELPEVYAALIGA